MKNLKRIILLIAIFISTIAFSQQVGVTVLRDKCITTAQRNAIVVTAGEQWKICNSDTGKNEFWNGSSWEETVSASGLPTEFINGDGTLNNFITVTQAVDLDVMETDTNTNNAKISLETGSVTKDKLAVALKTKVALGDVSGVVNIDALLGIHYTMNMTGNVTNLTFTNTTNEELKMITLEITSDGGSYTFFQPAFIFGDWTSFDSTLKNQIQIYMYDVTTPEFSSGFLILD